MSDRNFASTVEERDFYKERYERLLQVWNDEQPLRDQVAQLERQLDAAHAGQTLTLKEFDEKPREDWDFSELHDHLRQVTADRYRLREQVERLDRRASVYHDASLYWVHKAGERVEENTLLRASVARLEAQLENSRAANNLRQRRLDAAVTERDEAQAAAETYHAAWVGGSVARLPAARVAQRHECVHLVKPGPFKYIAFCSGHTKNDRETTADPAKVTCAKCKRLLKERE